jgi:hypothetical protein
VAPAPDRETALVVAAVFNSTWAQALAVASADEARGGYRRINARVAAQMPIPRSGAAVTDLAELSALLHAGRQLSQDTLDNAVANALDLTSETRKGLHTLASNLVGAASPRS